MSNTEKELKLPVDLPKCECFSADDPIHVMSRCADVSRSCHTMVGAFLQLAQMENLCRNALPYFAELFIISVLTSIAKTNGPALEYGSQEIEWEVERLLNGMEARVLARSRDIHARSRELGITEEMIMAMRERDAQDGGMQS